MIKRILSLFIVFFVLSTSLVYAECSFGNPSSDCEVFSKPFNTFNLNIGGSENLDSFEAKIYNKYNPTNEIKIQKNSNSFSNLNPFTEPGIYVAEVITTNRGGVVSTQNFEFIFDNSKPISPIIPLDLVSNSGTITVNGEGNFQNSVIIVTRENDVEIDRTTVGNDGLFSIDLSLNSGLNYFKFYTLNEVGQRSEAVERVIISDPNYVFDETQTGTVNVNGNLELVNFRTNKNGPNDYVTSKRNFYVHGSAGNSNVKVYANGNPTISTTNGNFGIFVNLNEGENEIEIVSGLSSQIINVEYVVPRFIFENINYEKIVNSDNLDFDISASLELPFNIYINGEFLREAFPSESTTNIPNLNEGKNYIYLEGHNSESYSTIVYRDSSSPLVDVLSEDDFAFGTEFYFKIEDDLGVRISNINVNIEGIDFREEDINHYGDIYGIDISNLVDGTYNYQITGNDRVGKTFTGETSGSFTKDESRTLIESATPSQMIGNLIFVNDGLNEITFKPSKFIAFESIYLDGVRQTDYEIKTNKDVEINLIFEKETGEIEFNFINKNRDQISQTFTYYSDSERPKLELDYIYDSSSSEGNTILITGEVSDSFFNWESMSFGGDKNYNRYGNYFEAYVELNEIGSNNILINGEDNSANTFDSKSVRLYNQNSQTELDILDSSENTISGSVKNLDTNSFTEAINYINSYDGTNTQNSILLDSFELVSAQRHGYRSVNMKGISSSGIGFRTLTISQIGNPTNHTHRSSLAAVPFKIYFTGNDINTIYEDAFIQGQVQSTHELTSVSIAPQNENCIFDEYNFVCIVSNLKDGENIFTITADNPNEDSVSKDFTINKIVNDLNVTNLGLNRNSDIYLKGDEYFTTISSYDVNGTVNKESYLTLVVDGREIPSDKSSGNFVINLDLTEELGSKTNDEIEIYVKAEDEYGNEAISNKIKVIYNRILETLVNVFLD